MELALALVGGFFLFVTVGLPLVTVGRLMRLTRRLDDLARRLDDVDRRVREAVASPAAPAPPVPVPAEPFAGSPPVAEPAPPGQAPVPEPERAAAFGAAPGPGAASVARDAGAPAAEPPTVVARATAGATARHVPTLEERIGARWLLYAAIAALVVGTSYFVKYAFDNEWITPVMRVVLGGAAGLALCEAGRRFASRDYLFYGQVLAGGGVVLLYVSAFAAFRFYALVSPAVAFGLLVGITAMAAALSDGQRAQPLAMLALVGGFAAPYLVGGNRDAHVALFSYEATLVAGALALARRHAWPLLNLVAFVLTCLSVLGWLGTGYTRARWLSTELFLTLFCAMFVLGWREARRHPGGAGRASAAVLALAPLFYHVATIAILAAHSLPLLIYLIAFTAAGVIAAEALGQRWLRLAVLVAVFLPLYAWTGVRRVPAWLLPGGVTIGAAYGLQLLASFRAVQEDAPRPRDLEVVLLHANGLALYLLLDPLLSDRGLITSGWLAALVGAWNLALSALARRWSTEAAFHHVALAFAFVAAAIAFEASGPWAAAGWAAEGAALSWIGIRARRGWLRAGGLALVGLALLRLADALLLPAPMGQTVIVNARAGVALFVIALVYLTAWLHVRARPQGSRRWAFEVGALVVAANLLTLLWVTAEIATWFGPLAAQRPLSGQRAARFAQQATTSIAWALHAVVLVGVGIGRRYTPVRYFAIALLVTTIGKVFFVDLARLDMAFRILSTIGLGLLLLVASYLYQRFQSGAGDGASPPAPPGPPPPAP